MRYVLDRPLKATPNAKMHFAIDFRTVAPTDKPGAYRFYIGRGVIASLAVECGVAATEFAVKNGAKWEVIRKLEPGTWYSLQLAIDPGKKTYSGVVGRPGDLTAFADKGVGPAWDGVIDTFICDAIGPVAGAAPARDLDNIALRDAPLPAPGGEPVKPVAPPAELKERLARIDAALAETMNRRAGAAAVDPYPVAYGVSEGSPANAKVQLRGEPDRPGPEVPRRFLEILGGDPLPKDAKGSGRLALAEWIARPTNPLTARVFVNRVWQGHFGRGVVATASDFGTRGTRRRTPSCWTGSRPGSWNPVVDEGPAPIDPAVAGLPTRGDRGPGGSAGRPEIACSDTILARALTPSRSATRCWP